MNELLFFLPFTAAGPASTEQRRDRRTHICGSNVKHACAVHQQIYIFHCPPKTNKEVSSLILIH